MKIGNYPLLAILIITLSSIALAQLEYDVIALRINEIICLLLNVIFWVIGIILTLVIIYRGLEYTTAENPEDRNEVKSKIIHAIVALAIIIAAAPFINYLIENTDIIPFTCTPEGYEHPGDCGECSAGYYTYCCCREEGRVETAVFYGDHCPYGVGLEASVVMGCFEPGTPLAEAQPPIVSCMQMCQARGYGGGEQPQDRRCCCYFDVRASIISPSNGDIFTFGDSITFAGSAIGGILPYTYSWTSDKDGNIGNTDSFTKDDLSVNAHTITLTIKDDRGSEDTASVDITVT